MHRKSYNNFIFDYLNKEFTEIIDSNNYTILVNLFIKYLNYDFKTTAENKAWIKNNVNNVAPEIFLYLLSEFIKKEKIIENYSLPIEIINKLLTINSYYIYDFESIKKFKENNFLFKDDIILNPELENEIYKDIPSNYNILEKSIYIYLKLCSILDYDDEEFLNHPYTFNEAYYKNISNLTKVTPINNKVICYTFNAIYAKFLTNLGLKVNIKALYTDTLSDTHSSLEYNVDNFMISADSTKSILKGDINNININNKLNGIISINENKNTKNSFNKILNDVYENFKAKELEKNNFFTKLLDEYQNNDDINEEIPFDEKLRILFKALNTTTLKGLKAIRYSEKLCSILFDLKDFKYHINAVIIQNNNPTNDNSFKMASYVFAVNYIELDPFNPHNNIYYIYNPPNDISLITPAKLQTLLDSNKYEHINDHYIMGF